MLLVASGPIPAPGIKVTFLTEAMPGFWAIGVLIESS